MLLKRKLVGRRYEDFIRHGIRIDLSSSENLWRSIVADPRYQRLLDRRKEVRRKTDQMGEEASTVFRPMSTILYLKDVFNNK